MAPRKSNVSQISNATDDGGVSGGGGTPGGAVGTPAKEKEKEKENQKEKDKDKEKDQGVNIEDLSLPRTMVARLAKGVLPPNTQLHKDAVLAMQKGATLFISHIAAAANATAQTNNRRTIPPTAILDALRDTEFDDFEAKVHAELARFNEVQTGKRNEYRRKLKEGKDGEGEGEGEAEEDTEHQERRQDGEGEGVGGDEEDVVAAAAILSSSSKNAPSRVNKDTDAQMVDIEDDEETRRAAKRMRVAPGGANGTTTAVVNGHRRGGGGPQKNGTNQQADDEHGQDEDEELVELEDEEELEEDEIEEQDDEVEEVEEEEEEDDDEDEYPDEGRRYSSLEPDTYGTDVEARARTSTTGVSGDDHDMSDGDEESE